MKIAWHPACQSAINWSSGMSDNVLPVLAARLSHYGVLREPSPPFCPEKLPVASVNRVNIIFIILPIWLTLYVSAASVTTRHSSLLLQGQPYTVYQFANLLILWLVSPLTMSSLNMPPIGWQIRIEWDLAFVSTAILVKPFLWSLMNTRGWC